ncbi:MAG: glutamate-cysteine ligase family protein [Lachnospiraceae bacterium]|nr:glutamate-cysteine ligase family protein [Lachnospiraceae bacterium]
MMTNTYKINHNKLIASWQKACKTSGEDIFGLEIEQFIVDDRTGKTLPYDEVEEILAELSPLYEHETRTHGHLIGLTRPDMAITIEPAAQLEFSAKALSDLMAVRAIIEKAEEELYPILRRRGAHLVREGYQPAVSIDDLPMIPKDRYAFMYRYFESLYGLGPHMMKGTASVHISMDYHSEAHMGRLYRAFYRIVPLLAVLGENTSIFENEAAKEALLRMKIWQYTDEDRVNAASFLENDGTMTFEGYAHFLEAAPVIVRPAETLPTEAQAAGAIDAEPIAASEDFSKSARVASANREKEVSESDADGCSEVYSEATMGTIMGEADLSDEALTHFQSMLFPYIRLKSFLELRVADSLPLNEAMAYAMIVKGLYLKLDELEQLEKRWFESLAVISADNQAQAETDAELNDRVCDARGEMSAGIFDLYETFNRLRAAHEAHPDWWYLCAHEMYGSVTLGQAIAELVDLAMAGLPEKERMYLALYRAGLAENGHLVMSRPLDPSPLSTVADLNRLSMDLVLDGALGNLMACPDDMDADEYDAMSDGDDGCAAIGIHHRELMSNGVDDGCAAGKHAEHRMMAPDPFVHVKGVQAMQDYLAGNGVTVGGQPVKGVYNPRIFGERDIAIFERIATDMASIGRKAMAYYKQEPHFRKYYEFSPLMHELIMQDPGYGAHLPMLRSDIFYDDKTGDFMFCEFNTDGSSGMIEDRELVRAFEQTPLYEALCERCRDEDLQVESFELFDTLAKAYVRIWRESRVRRSLMSLATINPMTQAIENDGADRQCHCEDTPRPDEITGASDLDDQPVIAIVDYLENASSLDEFEAYRDAFERAGEPCVVADIRELDFDGEALRLPDGRMVGAIYRRAVTSDILAMPREATALLAAYRAGRVCLLGGFETQVIHDKGFMMAVQDEAFLNTLTDSERRLVTGHMPKTMYLTKDEAGSEAVRNAKDRWVLKPVSAYGSKGVYMGSLCTEDEWAAALQAHADHGYICQEKIRPMESGHFLIKKSGAEALTREAESEDVSSVENEAVLSLRSFYNTTGIYAVDGHFMGLYSRMSEHEIITTHLGAVDAASVVIRKC